MLRTSANAAGCLLQGTGEGGKTLYERMRGAVVGDTAPAPAVRPVGRFKSMVQEHGPAVPLKVPCTFFLGSTSVNGVFLAWPLGHSLSTYEHAK